MFARILPFALLLAGCAPQNAVLTKGEYYAFISDTTSFSLQKGSIDPYDWGDEMWTIDCREFANAASRKAQQVDGIADDCEDGDNSDRCQDRRLKKLCDDWLQVPETEDPIRFRPEHETWLGQSPWWVLHEELDAWRGEAVLTSEGDLQIGFHHRLPGGEDFRFQFVVDPDFAPKQCDIETGEPVERDGDWVAEWSKTMTKQMKGTQGFSHMEKYAENGTLFFLNADGFQFNPDDTLDYWFMPEQWEAGAAGGKFADEFFFSRSPRWGYNEGYEYFETYDPSEGYSIQLSVDDLYFCELDEGENARDNTCWQTHEEELTSVVDSIRTDLGNALNGVGDPAEWSPMFHNNAWRTSDGTKAGFDGWHELHYNMVAFDQTPDQMKKLEAGDSLKGAFTLVFDGLDSNSRWLVRGEFEVPRIKNDRWVTEDVRARKLEENGNDLCVLQ